MAHQTHHSHQASQQLWDEAIAKIIELVSQQENIQTVDQAIDSLILTGGKYASASTHALYLQKVPESKGFTRKDISIYLAELGEDHETLQTYFQLVHFGGVSIEDSLRLFFTALRLEALLNTNMLNVLLTGLATAFKSNGGQFDGDIEDCICLYNGMIMLNDSLHNKYSLGRSRQTEQGFLKIINDGNAFDESEMRRIFHSIQKCPLAQTKGTHVHVSAAVPTQPVNGDSQWLKIGVAISIFILMISAIVFKETTLKYSTALLQWMQHNAVTGSLTFIAVYWFCTFIFRKMQNRKVK